jgi:hypothetical protein
VKFFPVDTTFKSYKWYFGDGDTSALIKPVHTYRRDNLYIVTLWLVNSNSCPDSVSELLDVIDAGVAGQSSSLNGFDIYPNPFSDFAVIRYELAQSGPVRIAVYDVLGNKKAILVDCNQSDGIYTYPFRADASGLSPGVYYIEFTVGHDVDARKIIYMK